MYHDAKRRGLMVRDVYPVVTTVLKPSGRPSMDVITIALLNSTATAFSPWRGSILAVDGNGACLRSFNISSRTMSVLAGSCGNAGFADGTLTQARFDHPTDVAVRERDGSIFLADSGNSIIRWIRPDLDSVSTRERRGHRACVTGLLRPLDAATICYLR